MPIKQIQLRGISRAPSDRATADGGSAESLNVHLDQQELAPTLPASLAIDITEAGHYLYIHKGSGYENIIYQNGAGYIKSFKRATPSVTHLNVFQLDSGETVTDISSVGNTLIICTNLRMEYVLYKDGAYNDLGSKIPVPKIQFKTREYYTRPNLPDSAHEAVQIEYADQHRVLIESWNGSQTSSDYNGILTWRTQTWQKCIDGDDVSEEIQASFNDVNAKIWEMIQIQIIKLKKDGKFGAPLFARYALRLYDGTYIYQSVPILLGGGQNQFITAYGSAYKPTGQDTWKSVIYAYLNMAYKVKAYLVNGNYTGWEDIVKSIDLFISTDIYHPNLHTVVTGISSRSSSDTNRSYNLSFETEDEDVVKFDKIKNEVLSKSIFYKVESFSIDSLTRLVNGYDMLTREDIASQDVLMEQDKLPDGYRSEHRMIADSIFKYNNKAIAYGIGQELTSGYPFLNGGVIRAEFDDSNNQQQDRYEFIFFLHGPSNEDLVVFGRDENGSRSYVAYEEDVPCYYRSTGSGSTAPDHYEHYQKPMAWLAYPDSRCYKVWVKRVTGNTTKIMNYPMEPHPNLECSFLFVGLDCQIANHAIGDGVHPGATNIPSANYSAKTENRIFQERNVLWSTLMDNPFVFPVTGKLTFNAEVIALATTTQALSEGQFGQFPLYVFTKDGIWTVPISSTGEFAASVPMSRDVAISKRAMHNMEQAIVFVTEQGVMLLAGSDVKNISPNMNGRHYVMESDLVTLLSGSDWGDLVDIEDDDEPFMSFVKSASIGYDYAGARLIFFKDGKKFQYVYHIMTETWHKVLSDTDRYNVINSYPECLVSVRDASVTTNYKLFDYCTVLDDEDLLSDSANPVKGLIVTRKLDLGEPDVRKTIRSIRIRGMFNRNDVKYILLGSFDGKNWKILTSLRGGSYKLFRIILLTNLAPTERISWIDVDYESRFATKLR